MSKDYCKDLKTISHIKMEQISKGLNKILLLHIQAQMQNISLIYCLKMACSTLKIVYVLTFCSQ